MNYTPKNWIAIIVSIVVIVAVATTAVFASKYYRTEEKRAAEAFKVAELEQQRLARLTPTISTNIFNCALPADMKGADHKDIYLNILSVDILSAQKAIVAILKKYPGAADGISNSNYEYTSRLPLLDQSSISINAKVPSVSIASIMTDIEKLAKADFIINTKNISTVSAENVESGCNSELINTQASIIKEVAYLNQLQKDSLDTNTINTLTQELSNVRNQFQSNKTYSYTDVKKTLNEASLNITINLLNG